MSSDADSIRVILASQSPRRKALLSMMGIQFDVVIRHVDESFPDHLDPVSAARYIAQKKASAFRGLDDEGLVIAADTVVTIDNQILGKPRDYEQAVSMLSQLAGRRHEVITAVALFYRGLTTVFHEITAVFFAALTHREIEHYVSECQPFDKAGAYGIQDWIGAVAVKRIEGEYNNVVGLPTQHLYEVLREKFPGVIR